MTRTLIPLTDDAPHILVVDDDNRIRTLLSKFLRSNGYRVTTAQNSDEARRNLQGLSFDLLVLDVMMPGENGFDLARRIRQESEVPILMLTARVDVDDRLRGLEIGADDYLGKPFEPRELLLRIAGILRRVTSQPPPLLATGPERVSFGPYKFHLVRGELMQDDDVMHITNRERDILRILAGAMGSTVPRAILFDNESGANERTIDVYMNRLRRKIETDATNPAYLQTVRGIGYKLVIDP